MGNQSVKHGYKQRLGFSKGFITVKGYDSLYATLTGRAFFILNLGGFGLRLIDSLKKIRDGYVINQVNHIKLPIFEPSPVVRNKLIFSGRVQKVGFRLETYELAKRLSLTGWVKNRADKNVEAEIQGENAKILFLIKYLKSLKRASVSNVEIQEMPLADDETNFTVIKNPCKLHKGT